MDYHQIAPLRAYIDRIGAEQLNFKRFMVKEYRGHYYIERCLIEIKSDGTISCGNERFAPTEDEAEAIKIALRDVAMPRYITAAYSKLRSLRLMIAESEQVNADSVVLFEFFNRDDDTLLMVQQRRQLPDGRKQYRPWTFWSDGVWRCMEPDSLLPFWKPRYTTNKAKIMVHEGAKAAQAATNVHQAHPWKDELDDYEHWGMIGGALAPHRSNWDDIRKQRPLDVVYVCDNDYAGRDAVVSVSRNLRYSLKQIKFGDAFPVSWDMADPLPPKLDCNGRWLGPTLNSLMLPATWATERVAIEGSKKHFIKLRREFAQEWLHCVQPEVFIHKQWPHKVWSAQEFNNLVKPFAETDDVARLIKSDNSGKTEGLKYSPELEPGTYVDRDLSYVNTYKPPSIKAERGDVAPFIDFVNHLCPVASDRTDLLRWCATLINRPNIKMMYGLLLISETQGVGKSTLGEKILAPLVGMDNVSFPSESDIVDSNYNYWASHKRLAIVHEIYAGHSVKAYNKLKSIITDHYITVSKKYMPIYIIDNWIHIFACSNSLRALKLSTDDRRWFVPMITDELRTPQYWEGFCHWLQYAGGLHFIRQWADDFVNEHGAVPAGSPAPWSVRKRDIIEENYSEGQRWVVGFLNQCKERMNGHAVLMTDQSLRDGIKTFIHEGRSSEYLESCLTIRKVAKEHGWFVGEDYATFQPIGNHIQRAKIIANNRTLANARNFEAISGAEIIDVCNVARQWQRM